MSGTILRSGRAAMVAGALALVSSPLAAAQISGKIVDEAGNPVPYVLSLIHISEPTRPY